MKRQDFHRPSAAMVGDGKSCGAWYLPVILSVEFATSRPLQRPTTLCPEIVAEQTLSTTYKERVNRVTRERQPKKMEGGVNAVIRGVEGRGRQISTAFRPTTGAIEARIFPQVLR